MPYCSDARRDPLIEWKARETAGSGFLETVCKLRLKHQVKALIPRALSYSIVLVMTLDGSFLPPQATGKDPPATKSWRGAKA